MAYVDRNLGPGETVVFRSGLTRVNWLWVAIALVALGWMSIALVAPGWMFGLGVLLALAIIVRQVSTEIAVTSRRFIFKTGLLFQKVHDIQLAKVESTRLSQGPIGRMLGYGKLSVRGTGVGSINLPTVDDPKGLKLAIETATANPTPDQRPRPSIEAPSAIDAERTRNQEPYEAAIQAPTATELGFWHYAKCIVLWLLVLSLYAVMAMAGGLSIEAWLVATGAMALVIGLGFVRPIPSIGVGRRLSFIMLPVVLLISAITILPTYGAFQERSRLAQLRQSDPQTYLIEIRKTASATDYESELKALDPKAYLESIRDKLPPHEYLAQLKQIDPSRYDEESLRIANEKAEKQAAHSAAIAQQLAERKARLAELRKNDPQAYLKEIEGTSEWASEFKKLDPQGYKAWTKKQAEEAAATASRASGKEYYDQSMDTQKIGWMQRGMGAIRAKLKDGDSAKFQNVFFVRGADGIPLTCGEVNSKNSFGAYGGFQRFVSGGDANLTFLEEEVSDFANVWSRFCQ